jgi:hypothetical protein
MKQKKEASSWQSLAILQWIVKNTLEDWVKLRALPVAPLRTSIASTSKNRTLSQKTSIGSPLAFAFLTTKGPAAPVRTGFLSEESLQILIRSAQTFLTQANQLI